MLSNLNSAPNPFNTKGQDFFDIMYSSYHRAGRKVDTPASSLPLILGSRKTSTHSSMSDFLEDPLARLRAQALRRVHTHVTRERRLAGVTCLLVTVFICCYLPFWTVYICLVRARIWTWGHKCL